MAALRGEEGVNLDDKMTHGRRGLASGPVEDEVTMKQAVTQGGPSVGKGILVLILLAAFLAAVLPVTLHALLAVAVWSWNLL